jgi:hypothetical protein
MSTTVPPGKASVKNVGRFVPISGSMKGYTGSGCATENFIGF